MQTTGAALLAFEPRSLAHVPTTGQDSRSACGLLYLAAVQHSFDVGHDHLIRRLCHARGRRLLYLRTRAVPRQATARMTQIPIINPLRPGS